MYQPNNQAAYTHHPYVPGKSMPPSIHNPSLSYPPQFQSLYSNPSVSLPPGSGPRQYPSNTPGFGPGQYPSNTPGFGAQPVYSNPPQFQSLYSNPSVSLPPGFGPGQHPSNTPGFGAQPVYSDPGAASANWVVRQSAPVTYSVHNLPEIRKTEGPWCDVCKISCTSTDCLNMHLVGKKHQKSLRELQQNPINTVSNVASLPLIIPNIAAAKTQLEVNTGETSAQHNLPKKRRVEEPWCDVCKISCTSDDGLNMHLVGKKHRKNLRKLQNPIN